MKALIIALCSLLLVGCKNSGKDVALDNQMDKVSYGIGLSVGKNLKRDSIKVNVDAFLRGVNDGLADSAKLLLSEDQLREVMTTFQSELRAKQMHAMAEKNRAEGERFLDENKSKQGVVTLASGLQYRVLKDGRGKKPTLNQTVVANYRGTLIDGTEFDNSAKRGGPAKFPLTGVIPGWTEALQHMSVGSRWMIFVPPNLAYGENGAGGVIGPEATLIFEIELVAIQ